MSSIFFFLPLLAIIPSVATIRNDGNDARDDGGGDLQTSNAVLNAVAAGMRNYRATPWYRLETQAWDHSTAKQWGVLDYRQFPMSVKRASVPYHYQNTSGTLFLTNPHAGDLLEHSKWAALQIAAWKQTNAYWMEGVDVYLALIATFFHDVGKARDCAFSCIQAPPGAKGTLPDGTLLRSKVMPYGQPTKGVDEMHCYLDTYSQLKYKGQGDNAHPIFCADFMNSANEDPETNVGEAMDSFWTTCPSEDEMKRMWTKRGCEKCNARLSDEYFGFDKMMGDSSATLVELMKWKKKLIDSKAKAWVTSKNLVKELKLSPADLYSLVISSRMHWELGRLNMPPSAPDYQTADQYLTRFAAVLRMYSSVKIAGGRKQGSKLFAFDPCTQKAETLSILKLSIAVAGADISGGSPTRKASRKGNANEIVYPEASNAAVAICDAAIKGTDLGLGAPANAFVKSMCNAGCESKEKGKCGITPVYPGTDVWTAYGFEDKAEGYRKSILDLFAKKSSSDVAYAEWCKLGQADLPESPRLHIRAVKVAEPRAKMFIYSFGLTAAGMASTDAQCDGNAGSVKITGLDVALGCSKRTPVTLPSEARASILIPQSATSFSYIYPNENIEHWDNGGFIYFDAALKVVAANYISVEAVEDWPYVLLLGDHIAATPDEYTSLHEYVLQGFPQTDALAGLAQIYDKMAWFPPGLIESAPHGGWVKTLKAPKA